MLTGLYTSSMAMIGDIMDPILANDEAKLSAFVLTTVGMISFVKEYPAPKPSPAVKVPSRQSIVMPIEPSGKAIVIRSSTPVESTAKVRMVLRPSLEVKTPFNFIIIILHNCCKPVFHKWCSVTQDSTDNARQGEHEERVHISRRRVVRESKVAHAETEPTCIQ